MVRTPSDVEFAWEASVTENAKRFRASFTEFRVGDFGNSSNVATLARLIGLAASLSLFPFAVSISECYHGSGSKPD